MSMYMGDYLEDAIVRIPFTLNAADGGRINSSASLEDADIIILKDGVDMGTLDASAITINSGYGTGVYTLYVNMSSDVDFTTGSDYAAILYPDTETVDSQSVAGVLATWSCENRVDAMLKDYHLDHLFKATYDPSSKPGVADALLNELIENDGGVSRFTENALENSASGYKTFAGTCQAGSTASTIVLASGLSSYADDFFADRWMVQITGGTGEEGEWRLITDWVASSQTATVEEDWTTTPDATTTYKVIPTEIKRTSFWTWDEVITGANHNVQSSAAKFLREASQSVAGLTGTAQSGSNNTIVLESGGVTSDDILNGERITIIEGAGVGQSRLIKDSTASSDTVEIYYDWIVNPDNTSVYSITGAEVDLRAIAETEVLATTTVDFADLASILASIEIAAGTCQAGSTSTTIVLASGTSSFSDDFFNDRYVVEITGGTGVTGEWRNITDWVSSTQTATVDSAWSTTPDATTTYRVRRALHLPNQKTILNRIGAWTGSGINTILGAFKAMMRKDASLPSDIGGTHNPATDSQEAQQESLVGLTGYIAEVNISHDHENDKCKIWVSVRQAGQRVDIDALDAAASCTVTVREHDSGSNLFSANGAAADLTTNYAFEFEEASPGFPAQGSKTYIAVASVTASGSTISDGDLVFDAWGAPS